MEDGTTRDARQQHSFMAEIALPILAVVAFGGGIAAFAGDPPVRAVGAAFNQRFGGGMQVTELSPAGYEALRDLLVENPTIAPALARDFADGRIDTAEMLRIVGDQRADPAPTRLDQAHARADLAATLSVHSHGALR